MPLSKEKMREYMKEYRLKNPEYEEKHKQQSIENFKNKYNTNPEFKERVNTLNKQNMVKKKLLVLQSVESC